MYSLVYVGAWAFSLVSAPLPPLAMWCNVYRGTIGVPLAPIVICTYVTIPPCTLQGLILALYLQLCPLPSRTLLLATC